jgi:hypothetical protein
VTTYARALRRLARCLTVAGLALCAACLVIAARR